MSMLTFNLIPVERNTEVKPVSITMKGLEMIVGLLVVEFETNQDFLASGGWTEEDREDFANNVRRSRDLIDSIQTQVGYVWYDNLNRQVGQ